MTISIGFSSSVGLTGSVSLCSSVEGACWLIVAFVISAKGVPRDCDASGITDGCGLGDGGVGSTTFLLVATLRDDRVGRGVGGAEAITIRSVDGQSQIVIPMRARGLVGTIFCLRDCLQSAGPALPVHEEPQPYLSVHFAEPMGYVI